MADAAESTAVVARRATEHALSIALRHRMGEAVTSYRADDTAARIVGNPGFVLSKETAVSIPLHAARPFHSGRPIMAARKASGGQGR